MEQQWPYKRTAIFDFWRDFRKDRRNKEKARRKEKRKRKQRILDDALSFAWWSEEWWLTFVFEPLAQKYGADYILKQDLPMIFKLRNASSNNNEIEEYHSWKYDLDHKDKDQNSPSDDQMKHVMESEKNYAMFLRSRGFTG